MARRNLTDEQRLLVLGRMYERRKKDQMQNLKQFSSGQIVHSEREGTAATAKAIAAVAGVNEKTVRRAAEFAKAVQIQWCQHWHHWTKKHRVGPKGMVVTTPPPDGVGTKFVRRR
jgi:hypothetical protein